MLENLIEQLAQVLRQRKDGYVQDFENVLGQVAVLNNAMCIPMLLRFFDDDAEYDEMMFSIIHTIEVFDEYTYAEGILDSLPGFLAKSPRWATIVHMRILNSPPALAAYTEQIKNLPEERRTCVRNMLEAVRQKDARFDDRCAAMLADIGPSTHPT